MSVNFSGRFGLFEMILVTTIIGILAAAGVTYYGQIVDGAREAAVEAQARAFTAVVSMIHWSWSVKGSNFVPATERVDALVLIDTQPVYLNGFGWPTHAEARLSRAGLSSLGCLQVWDAIMQNPGNIRVRSTETLPADGLFYVSAQQGRICHYETLTPSRKLHYFNYNVVSGRVDIVMDAPQ